MPSPDVTISFEPIGIDNHLVYLAAVPLSAGEVPNHFLHFVVSITNEGTVTETLENITAILFPNLGSPVFPQFFGFEQNLPIGPGNTGEAFIVFGDNIPLPNLPFVQYQIALNFVDRDEPVVANGITRAHVSPTTQGSYRFFGHTNDMDFDEYFVQSRHKGPMGQFFGYDIKVWRWISELDQFWLTDPDSSGTENEHYFGYGKPLYAQADGTVISAINNIEENPGPGKRALMRIAENEAERVDAISLVRLGDSRVATAVRSAANARLRIILWELQTPGNDVANSQLIRLGEIGVGERITDVDAFYLANSRIVTAVRLLSGTLKIIIWEISDDGLTLTRLGEDESGAISRLAAARLTNSRIVVAAGTAAGILRVMVWDISIDGHTLTRLGEAGAGEIDLVDVAALGTTRFLTAVRTQAGLLLLTLWEIDADGAPVHQEDEVVPGNISDLSLSWIRSPGGSATVRAATAVLARNGQLNVAYWAIDGSNNIQSIGNFQGGQAVAVKVGRVDEGGDDIATGVLAAGGTLQLTTYKFNTGELNPYAQNSGGAGDLIDLVWLKDEIPHFLVTAVRNAQQRLELNVWFLAGGGGNHIITLHGDELVYVGHMQEGSLNPALLALGTPVQEGQFIGRLGNTGSSGAPHFHVDVRQHPPDMTVEEMIAAHQMNELRSNSVARPIPFHNAQAMRLSAVEGGVFSENPFSTVDGDGFYWTPMAIWPGLTTPGIPTGRPSLVFWAVLPGLFQILIDKVSGANYHLAGISGYTVNNQLLYIVVFHPNPAPLWSVSFELPGKQYDWLVRERQKEGFRPVHVNSYRSGNGVRYAAIFREEDGVVWEAYQDKTAREHRALRKELSNEQFVPVNISVVWINRQRRYTALYEKRDVGVVHVKSFLTLDALQQESYGQEKAGLHLVYLDACRYYRSARFSAVWHQEYGRPAPTTRHNLSGRQLQEEMERAGRDGLQTAMVAGYVLDGQPRFTAVWRK